MVGAGGPGHPLWVSSVPAFREIACPGWDLRGEREAEWNHSGGSIIISISPGVPAFMMLCWLPGAITAFGGDYLSLVPNTLISCNALVKISSTGRKADSLFALAHLDWQRGLLLKRGLGKMQEA